MAPKNKISPFYKGILFRENFQSLTLPIAFGPYLNGRPSTKVFLRNPYRDIWPVEMVRRESGEYTFEGGWPRFAALNKLEYKDFLIFQYDGNTTFDFKIYGTNMDEKEYTRLPEVKPDPDEVEQPRQQRRAEVVQHKEMEPERELEQEVEEDEDDFLFEREEQSTSRNRKRRKRAVVLRDAELDKVFESEEIPRPDNPYFMTRVRSERDELYIPIDVVEAFHLRFKETIELCDERNRRWSAKVHWWQDGRIWLSGGWKKICNWNNVKYTDLCLCEFVPATQEHNNMFLKVRVLPDAALKLRARRSS